MLSCEAILLPLNLCHIQVGMNGECAEIVVQFDRRSCLIEALPIGLFPLNRYFSPYRAYIRNIGLGLVGYVDCRIPYGDCIIRFSRFGVCTIPYLAVPKGRRAFLDKSGHALAAVFCCEGRIEQAPLHMHAFSQMAFVGMVHSLFRHP